MNRRPRPLPGLHTRPAPAAAAQIGLALLDEARAACGRLDDPDDVEALHDFRVALRRLRTLLRSFRPVLGRAISKKLQRRLRDMTRATSAGRDAEVQLGWVRDHRDDLGPRPRPGLAWFLARLEDRRDRAYAKIRGDITGDFRQLERRARRALNAALVEATGAAPAGSPFGSAVARLIREHVAALEQELAAARSPRDEDAIHGARIAVKRLRYLLEPLTEETPLAGAAAERLKQLQNLLGELHDLQILVAELGEAAAEAAADRARRLHAAALRGGVQRKRAPRQVPRPASAGPLAVAHLASAAQEELFRRLDTEWLAGAVTVLTRDLQFLGDSLTAAPVPAPRLPRPRQRRPERSGRHADLAP